jgi:hypothetical protein
MSVSTHLESEFAAALCNTIFSTSDEIELGLLSVGGTIQGVSIITACYVGMDLIIRVLP